MMESNYRYEDVQNPFKSTYIYLMTFFVCALCPGSVVSTPTGSLNSVTCTQFGLACMVFKTIRF